MIISNEEREQIIKYKNAIASYLVSIVKNGMPTDAQIKTETCKYCTFMYPELIGNDNYINEIIKLLLEQFQFKLEIGVMLYEEEAEPWFKDFKNDNENYYFERYKTYLLNDCSFSNESIRVLDEEILDTIMDYLGDPRQDYFNPRRGLVMGDVQSGKTSTYTGLICKAADAGYKAIIVLTGMVESLRVQTQKRLDLGFVGFDSSHMKNEMSDDFWIGVGKYNRQKKGIVLTSAENDFVSKTAQNLGFSLESFNDTVLFVVKKNTTVLQRLIKWLRDLNGDPSGKINFPLLVIDDEADNASINTKEPEEDPSKINSLIRELLDRFMLNNYVGFTATPFANIFINPNETDDLFPRDFIYCLKAPENYIGPSQIFVEGAKYSNAIRFNNDCNEVLPVNHKKYAPFDVLPSTLRDAMFSYFLSNVIRDLRGDNYTHRGMLINISSYVSTHENIKNTVQNFYNEVLRKYALYCKDDELSKNEEILKETKKVFKREYSNLEFSWDIVREQLFDSNKRIQVLIVNKDSSMINYDDYKENGARVIVIGGLALSRGLTIEGLCISYFFRYSKTYDVLLQMGRWFGYRKHYDDLFRIWLPTELKDWYAVINESVEELKLDLERMRIMDKKPKDFGLRIRNDKTSLRITAANKMKTAATQYVTISIFGDFVDTPCIAKDIITNKNNFKYVEEFLYKIKENERKQDSLNKRVLFKNIKKAQIIEFLKEFQANSLNPNFDKDGLINFIDSYDGTEFDEFDVVIIEGDKRKAKQISIAGYNISTPSKQFDCYDNCIRINKSRLMLVNPIDMRDGLNNKINDELVAEGKKLYLKAHPTANSEDYHPSAKLYLSTKERNPILAIYLIDLNIHADDDQYDYLVQIKKYFEDNGIMPIGIALGIPKYRDSGNKECCYKINIVEQQRQANEINEGEEL